MWNGCEIDWIGLFSIGGLERVLIKDLLICAFITISYYLALSEASNHVCGHCIMTFALITYLIPLVKHYSKNKLDCPCMWINNFS
jgi:hypothetical protein